ncbi:phosphatidylglycerophosphatase A [bacterium]|nr:phosphatidylglycerophosphatase A [bacterium]
MLRRLIYIVATGLYSGYSPLAPGTAGSALGLLIFMLIPGFRNWILLSACIIFFLIGVWSATQVEKMENKKDASIIVIDEIVGMWIALLFIPVSMNWIWWMGAFVLFRIYDVIKPFPAGKSQELPSGWGVMVDDVWAGFYANVTLEIVYLFFG